jgi:K+-sensing histidine kinase KdpD
MAVDELRIGGLSARCMAERAGLLSRFAYVAIAVLATGLAALVLLWLEDVIPDRVQVLVLAMPIAAVTWRFGMRAGLVAVVVGAVVAAFLLVPPVGLWAPPNSGDLIATILFTVVALVIVVVIGQLRDSREELRDQNRILAETVAQKERLEVLRDGFGAILAHELRTPLTVILGDAQLLQAASGERGHDQAVNDLARDIEDEATRLHRLVEDLLVVSRGLRELHVTVEPILVQRVLATVATESARRNPRLRIRVDAPEDLPAADGDPLLCEQILGNLISNAVKYAGPAAVVVLTASAVAGTVAIRCEDDGPGFPRAAIAHVFDPFYRVPGSERRAPGAGVGLYVVRQLVEAMHGEVEASNALPDGHAVVTIRLPATAEPDSVAPSNTAAQERDVASPRPMAALIVGLNG